MPSIPARLSPDAARDEVGHGSNVSQIAVPIEGDAKCGSGSVVRGNPDPKHVSTSHVERQNLSMRMSIRRFTRLTNAFSKKVENHAAAVALWFMYYNFCRVHQTLRVTPAMEAGLTDHVWTIAELVTLTTL
jgi:hypothetical protein